jgi:hypothetical protein
MASFKTHPIFYTALILAGAITAGQAWLLFSQRSATQKIRAEIEEKKATLSNFSYQNPFPSRENQTLVEAERAAAEKTLGEIRSLLQASSEVAETIAKATPPSSPTDAYFDIANYVERLRAKAREAKVTFAADNRFGFATYATTGPERGLIPSVFNQRQYAEYLISALLTSENPPKEFVSLQRERPLTEAQRTQIAEALASGQTPPAFEESGASRESGGDFFVIDSRTSARVPGSVNTVPFRLTFVGNTAVLRDFLNELALFKVPVVVRSVEVESLAASGQSTSPAPQTTSVFSMFGSDTAAAPVEVVKPLVEQVDSRFIVTVEIVSLVDKNAPPAEASDAATNP